MRGASGASVLPVMARLRRMQRIASDAAIGLAERYSHEDLIFVVVAVDVDVTDGTNAIGTGLGHPAGLVPDVPAILRTATETLGQNLPEPQ